MKKPKHIRDFLDAIYAGAKVEWQRFERLLANKDIPFSVISTTFNPDERREKRTTVSIINWSHFEQLLRRFPPVSNQKDRVSAALTGNTHQAPSSGGMMILRRVGQAEPFVTISEDKRNWTAHPVPGSRLVIVENMENFIAFDKLLAFLSEYCHIHVDESLYVAYGAGMSAGARGRENYYSLFDSVDCLFDLDVGGLMIYRIIQRLMAKFTTPVNFASPSHARHLLANSNRLLDEKDRHNLIELRDSLPEMGWLVAHMLNTGRKLEQEVYLA